MESTIYNANMERKMAESNEHARSLAQFLDQYKLSPPTKGNFINLCNNKNLKIPDDKVVELFERMATCIEHCAPIYILEMQGEQSGFYLDVDFKQKRSNRLYREKHIKAFVQSLTNTIADIVDLQNTNSLRCLVTSRSAVTLDSKINLYKDGLHFIFPLIKIRKEVKIMIINKIIENKLYDAFAECGYEHLDRSIDRQSAVNAILLPNCRKVDSGTSYDFVHMFICIITKENVCTEIIDSIRNFDRTTLFKMSSLNYDLVHDYPKQTYDVRTIHAREALLLAAVPISADSGNEKMLQDISQLSPQFDVLVRAIECLNTERAESYKEWMDFIFALSFEAATDPHNENAYRDLAQYFSEKCPSKFSQTEFNRVWKNTLERSKEIHRSRKISDHVITAKSIMFWAKMDNKTKYEESMKASAHGQIRKLLTSPEILGTPEPSQVADVILPFIQNKYKTYSMDSSKLFGYGWLEFMDPITNPKDPPINYFKWCNLGASFPPSLSLYIFDTFAEQVLFVSVEIQKWADSKIQEYEKRVVKVSKLPRPQAGPEGQAAREEIAKQQKENEEMVGKIKMLKLEKKRALETHKKLKKHDFVNDVIRSIAIKTYDQVFYETLDKIPGIVGVRNGVLVINDDKIELIQTHHTLPVSKSIKAGYYPDKYTGADSISRFIIVNLEKLFPPNEEDAFNYIKYLFSTTLIKISQAGNRMHILHSSGRSGKSCLTSLLENTIGEPFCAQVPNEWFFSSRKDADAPSAQTAKVEFARLVITHESADGLRLHADKLKQLTSGGDLTCRGHYEKKTRTFTPNVNILLDTNKLPQVPDKDYGAWRRLWIYRFKYTFCDPSEIGNNMWKKPVDVTVLDRFRTDENVRDAFLCILLRWHKEFKAKHGCNLEEAFIKSPTIQREFDIFRKDQDFVYQFITRKIFYAEGEKLFPETIYENFNVWFKRSQSVKTAPFPQSEFINVLEDTELAKYKMENEFRETIYENMKIILDNAAIQEGEVPFLYYRAEIERKKRELARLKEGEQFTELELQQNSDH